MLRKSIGERQKENRKLNHDDPKIVSKTQQNSEQIKKLKSQLMKKKQLIKILEKKCGKNIILCKNKLTERVDFLEKEKEKLQLIIHEISESSSTLANSPSRNLSQDSDEKKLKELIVFQTLQLQELKTELKKKTIQLEESQNSNKELRKNLLQKTQKNYKKTIFEEDNFEIKLRKNRLISEIDENFNDMNVTIQKDKHTQYRRFFKSLESIRKISCGTQVQEKKSQLKDQSIQTLLKPSQEIGIQAQEVFENILEESTLKNQLSSANDEISILKEELEFFSVKIQGLYNEKEFPNFDEELPPSEMEMDYIQILQVFGINHLNEKRQKVLLKEIESLKTNMIGLVGEIKKMEKDLSRVYNDNYGLQNIVNTQKSQFFNLQEFNTKNSEILDEVNQELLKEKAKVLSFRIAKKLEMLSND